MRYIPINGNTKDVHLYLSPEGKLMLKALATHFNETYSVVVSYLMYVAVKDNPDLQYIRDSIKGAVKGGSLPLGGPLDGPEKEAKPEFENQITLD